MVGRRKLGKGDGQPTRRGRKRRERAKRGEMGHFSILVPAFSSTDWPTMTSSSPGDVSEYVDQWGPHHGSGMGLVMRPNTLALHWNSDAVPMEWGPEPTRAHK